MIPWKKLDSAPLPPLPGKQAPPPGMSGRTMPSAELVLWEHDGALVIRVGHTELMSSRQHFSEDELGRLACAHLTRGHVARVLVGGLGMGFTLRAVLDAVGPKATVEVAELVPGVVAWNRGVLGPLAGHPLTDKRVRLYEQDVAARLRPGADYDAILLDVDNGPVALTTADNRQLYDRRGLDVIRDALKPGGVLAVWSASDDPRFTKRVRSAGFDVLRHHTRARPNNSGAIHVLSIATKLETSGRPRAAAADPANAGASAGSPPARRGGPPAREARGGGGRPAAGPGGKPRSEARAGGPGGARSGGSSGGARSGGSSGDARSGGSGGARSGGSGGSGRSGSPPPRRGGR